MKPKSILRTRCIFSRVLAFGVLEQYKFEKFADYSSFSVYKPLVDKGCYATRLLDDCGVLVIESGCEVLAVFEVL